MPAKINLSTAKKETRFPDFLSLYDSKLEMAQRDFARDLEGKGEALFILQRSLCSEMVTVTKMSPNNSLFCIQLVSPLLVPLMGSGLQSSQMLDCGSKETLATQQPLFLSFPPVTFFSKMDVFYFFYYLYKLTCFHLSVLQAESLVALTLIF